MEQITVGQIFEIIIKLGAVVGAMGGLAALIIRGIKNILIPIRIKMLKSDLATLMCLADNNLLSAEQKILAHEEYDEYTKVYNQNSWVHDKFESLVKEGKL